MIVTESLDKKLKTPLLDLYVLTSLEEGPTYGYALMTMLKKRFRISASPSTVYPVLYDLEQCNYVTAKWDHTRTHPRKMYELTPKGKRFLTAGVTSLKLMVAPFLTAQ